MKKLYAAVLLFMSTYHDTTAQCTPAIPATALVIQGTITNNGGFDPCWVCSGDTLISNGGIRDVFLEPGSVMLTGGGIDNIYVLGSARLIMTGGIHDIYYVNFSDLTLSGGISTPIPCPALAFNYVNAPVNGCPPSTPVSGTVTVVTPTCSGGCNGTATASGTGGQPPYTYQWIGGPSNAVYSNLCAGTYEVIITDANSKKDTLSAVVNDPPLITSAISANACVEYSFGGNLITASGTYTDTLSDHRGCDSVIILSLTIDPVDVNVTKSGNTLTASAIGATYKWLDCDNGLSTIPGSIGQIFSGLPGKSYAVVVTQGSCTDTSACIGINPTGIDDSPKQALSVYPNPAKNRLFVRSEHIFDHTVCAVMRSDGALVFETRLNGKNPVIDISSLEEGHYLLKIPGEQKIHRFVVF